MSSAPPWRLKATSLEAPATPAAQPTPPRHRQRWQRHRRRPPSRGGRRRRVVCSLPRVPEGRGRTFSAALARGGRRSPPRHRRPAHEAPPGSWRSSGPLPLHLRRRRSRGGSEHVHLFIPPLLLRRVGTPGQDSLKKFLAARWGLGGATTRSVSGHRWPPWPPWPPLGRDSQKKILAARWGRSRLSAAIGRPCSMPAGAGSGGGVSF